ncbi:NAD(P)-binding protein [Aulographum hederae CBS 113979]|uniref:NAD(P)-binding protein n=1 Tax=Aulographum hederae CBS 113979 TaxID=1176131 RepID=A0A6G1HDT1_9PEZI|nr:NAD(P)-binding protein [Aulographum hederae CBS 113979]
MDSLPADYFVTSMQFTKKTYRDQYPAIDPTSPALSQAGKVIVITGASRGLGARAFAPAFAKAGPKAMVLVARDLSKLHDVEKQISSINPSMKLLSIATDISSPASVTALFSQIVSTLGAPDVLINNAGVNQAMGPISSADPEAWEREFNMNAYGAFLMTQGFLKAVGSEKKATLINLTTGAAYGVFPGLAAYSISKLVAWQITAFVGVENENVTAVALHPGVVATEMLLESFERFAGDRPELVGGVAVWLCSGGEGEGGRKWLDGRFVSANWDVEGLEARREEVVEQNLLTVGLNAKLGREFV